MSAREFAKWADDVDELKRRGDLQKAVAQCSENFPFPYAFTNAAIIIRKQIRDRRKNEKDYEDLLEELYRTAVCENFFRFVKWTAILDNRLCSLTARPFVGRIAHPYPQIGYQNLELLNTTDKKWIVEKWGEPDCHNNAKVANQQLWQEAVEKFAAAAKKSLEELWRSHGFDPP
jgi:hypothetical protein